MSSLVDPPPPPRRPLPPTPGPRDGDGDPLTPEQSAAVVSEALDRINERIAKDVDSMRIDTAARLAAIEGRIADLVAHGTIAQRVHADSETTARHEIDARRLVAAARWQAVQTLIAAPPVQAGLVAGGGAVVVTAAAVVWYLLTGEMRPPIPGVAP